MKSIKTVSFLLAALFVSSILYAQTPPFEWQHTWNSSQAVQCFEIAPDSEGNIYVSGTFRATVDLDPGIGIVNATSAMSFNGFIVKLSSEGLYIWSIAYPVELTITAIKISASGDVLLGGRFRNPVDFDPGSGTTLLTNVGLADSFLARYTSGGELVWAKSFGSIINDGIQALAEAPNGEIIVAGDFQLAIDFDPGVGETIINQPAYNSTDGFFSRFDADGNFLAVTVIPGDQFNEVNGVGIDPDGNIIVAGRYTNTLLFNANGEVVELNTEGDGVLFIAKFNAMGEFIWAKDVAGDYNMNLGSTEVDAQSNTYLTGYISGTGDFDPGDDELLIDGGAMGELFMMKLNEEGNLVWAHQLGVPESQEFGLDLSVDANQNLYLTGVVTGNVDFDLGPGVVNLPGVTLDAFVLVMNSNAEFIWVSRFGYGQEDLGYSVVPVSDGSVYACGLRLPSGDSPHSFGYLYKYAPSTLNTSSTQLHMLGIEIFPNPSKGIFQITAKDEITAISVFDMAGKEIKRYAPNAPQTNIDLSPFESGLYVVQITTGNAIHAGRIVKE